MNAQVKRNPETQIELRTRVALHPFLAGMNPTQLTLLTDCAAARHFTQSRPFSAKESLRMDFI